MVGLEGSPQRIQYDARLRLCSAAEVDCDQQGVRLPANARVNVWINDVPIWFTPQAEQPGVSLRPNKVKRIERLQSRRTELTRSGYQGRSLSLQCVLFGSLRICVSSSCIGVRFAAG